MKSRKCERNARKKTIRKRKLQINKIRKNNDKAIEKKNKVKINKN